MAEPSRRQRVIEYAFGMAAESLWILAMTVLALLMAVVAKVLWP